jgi:GT2 family glycosyltransferase
MGQKSPFFSIIVPTYNRPRQLAACLQSMCNLDYPRDRFQVVVIDDGSERTPDDIIGHFRGNIDVSLVKQPHRGPAAARNAGAGTAKGHYLAFTGDDCSPSHDWLRALARCFAREPDSALGGSVINGLSGNACSTATHLLISYLYTYYNACSDSARFFTPNNFAVPAHRFSSIGGFDPSFDLGAGEDREFCDRWLRRGYGMVYAADAVVFHTHALTFREFLRLHSNYGRGTHRYRAMLAQRNGEHIQLEPLRFYLNLVRYPLLEPKENRQYRLAVLLGISQIANAVGYFSEHFNRNRTRWTLI